MRYFEEPFQEKTFFRLVVHAYDMENDQPVFVVLHKEKDYKPGDPFGFAAGRFMPGERDEAVIKKALKEDFGIESFDLIRIEKDGFGTDKQGQQVPRLAYHADTDKFPLEDKKITGLHATWIPCDDCAKDSKTEEAFANATAEQVFQAVRESYAVELDYSKASLDKLESLIDTIIRDKKLHIPFSVPLPAPIPLSFYLGEYLGAVLVKNLGGVWVRKFGLRIEEYEDGTWRKLSGWSVKVPGKMKEGTVFANPIGKARKRVTNGAEDSLSFFYEGVEKATKGELNLKR